MNFILGIALPVYVFFSGLYMAARLKFFYIRRPLRILKELGNSKEGIKPLFMALAGTLGVGNIAGVALAIIYGGAGSVFWMWASALVSMSLKYSETCLAMRYRVNTPHGSEGGAMYYMRDGAGARKTASLFAFFCILSSFIVGGVIQSNTVSECFDVTYGINIKIISVILSVSVLLISVGGGRTISNFCAIIVPLMSVLYIGMCLLVVLSKPTGVIDIFKIIISSAFDFKSAACGVGISALTAIRYGVLRGLFSNEAGIGTSPMAHASAKTEIEAKQGIMGIFEVGADTLLVCSLTAFAILSVFNEIPSDIKAMELINSAFSSVIGGSAEHLIAICITFFAFATIIMWAYYGCVAVRYFTDSRVASLVYSFIFSISVYIGGVAQASSAWLACDILSAVMTFINVFFIIKMTAEVKKLTAAYGLISPD